MIEEILQSETLRQYMIIFVEGFIVFLLQKLNKVLATLDRDLNKKNEDKQLLKESVEIRQILQRLEAKLGKIDGYS